MRKFPGLLAAAIISLTGTAAAAEVSGNISIATDYVFRGISQTDEEPTVQGGLDFVAANGFYAGVWASNIAFDGSIEMDFYLGFANDITDDWSYDFKIIHYNYPNQKGGHPDSDFYELSGSGSYKNLTFGLDYSNEFSQKTGRGLYIHVEYDIPMPNDMTLGLHVGSQSVDEGTDYEDFSVGVSKEFGGVDISLTWYDTDLSTDTGASRIVLGFSKTL